MPDSQKLGMPVSPEELTRTIEGCNNGYLYVPNGRELKCAKENPALFVVTVGTYPPFYVRIFTRESYNRWYTGHANTSLRRCREAG